MEIIRGKQTSTTSKSTLDEQIRQYDDVLVDIGTGDGRYVKYMACAHPNRFFIGVDAARDNLFKVCRRAPTNALYVVANAETMPTELYGLASSLSINFPWGSLLRGLLVPDSTVVAGLCAITRPGAAVAIHVNAGALGALGYRLQEGASVIRNVLQANGFSRGVSVSMTANDLAAFPSTWAKRLSFGRDPRAMALHSVRDDSREPAPALAAFLAVR